VASSGARRPSGLALALACVVAAVVMALVGLLVVSALGLRSSSDRDPRNAVDADTARFSYGDRSASFTLVECGREDDVVIMAGRQGRMVLQVAADLGDGGLARTGVTADLGDDGTLGAFGADLPQGPVGELTEAHAEGDTLVVEGRWAAVDPDTLEVEAASSGLVDGRLVARCPPEDLD
jgi:hypothetical protein